MHLTVFIAFLVGGWHANRSASSVSISAANGVTSVERLARTLGPVRGLATVLTAVNPSQLVVEDAIDGTHTIGVTLGSLVLLFGVVIHLAKIPAAATDRVPLCIVDLLLKLDRRSVHLTPPTSVGIVKVVWAVFVRDVGLCVTSVDHFLDEHRVAVDGVIREQVLVTAVGRTAATRGTRSRR